MPVLPGKGHNCLIKGASHSFSPAVFIYAQVVNIKGLNICHQQTVYVLLKDAEGISQNGALRLFRHKDRAAVIFYNFQQFFL